MYACRVLYTYISDAGFFVYVTFVLNHLALLRRLGLANHCAHVHFGGAGCKFDPRLKRGFERRVWFRLVKMCN